MLLLKQVLWLFFLYIEFFSLQGCKAAIATKNIWMEKDEDSQASFALKPARRLLDWGNNQPWKQKTHTFTTATDYTPFIIFVVVSLLMFVAFFLIQYCMRLARESNEAMSPPGITVHAPPCQRNLSLLSSSAIRRPLATPMTSRSLILLPEEQFAHTLFPGIENPNYIPPTTANVSDKEQNCNPTPLLDLPPAYDTVVKADSTYTT